METINSCGDCQECCIVLKIDDLNKLAYKPCFRLDKNGCTDYKNRPQTCRRFNCTWLLSGWKEEYRPDKLGMMFLSTRRGLIGVETKEDVYSTNKKVKALTSKLAIKTDLTIELYPR